MTATTFLLPQEGVPMVADDRVDPGIDPARVEAALDALFDAHYTTLVRVAVLLVRDPETAEDLVQDAFVDMCRRWPRLEDPDRAAGYLRTSVVNRARSVLRHRKVADRHRRTESSLAPAADQIVLGRARRDAVIDALAMLPRRQREVLVLRHYLELSEEEIAATLGIGRGSVKTHASRGAATLRRTLGDQR